MPFDFSEQIRSMLTENADDRDASARKLEEFHKGFFPEEQPVALAQRNRCSAKVAFAVTGSGVWFYGLDLQSDIAGSYGFPSVWNRIGYATRGEAMAAAVKRAVDWFRSDAESTSDTVSDSLRRDCLKMIEMLQPEQASLF